MQHQINDIIQLFNQLFAEQENTRLLAGDDEPIYLPADTDCEFNRVIFAHGFFASALHEIAHWCIAGQARRKLVDYGYWYEPDGRTAEKQLEFAQVEAKPQAMEWILAQACGYPFVISLDNLSGETVDITPFKQAVVEQVRQLQSKGVGPRAEQLINKLSAFYQQSADYRHYVIELEKLR